MALDHLVDVSTLKNAKIGITQKTEMMLRLFILNTHM
jgi:hypothetical protein